MGAPMVPPSAIWLAELMMSMMAAKMLSAVTPTQICATCTTAWLGFEKLTWPLMSAAAMYDLGWLTGAPVIGAGWTVVAGFMLTVGHFAAIMAMATHFYGVRCGYRTLRGWFDRLSPVLTLEHALAAGLGMMLFSAVSLVVIAAKWRAGGFLPLPSVLPLVGAVAVGAVGMQTALGGFLLAIIAGHDAAFVPSEEDGQ